MLASIHCDWPPPHLIILPPYTSIFAMEISDSFDLYAEPTSETLPKLLRYLEHTQSSLSALVYVLNDSISNSDQCTSKEDVLRSLSPQEQALLSCRLLRLSSAGVAMHRLLFDSTMTTTASVLWKVHQEILAAYELHHTKLSQGGPNGSVVLEAVSEALAAR